MIPRIKYWRFHVSLTELLIITPLFVFRCYANNPCYYADMLETGIEFGWLPYLESKYHAFGFKWHRVWREL